MEKLRLRLEELAVESFDTAGAAEEKGTVFGAGPCTCGSECTCPGPATCDETECLGTCGACCTVCFETCGGATCDIAPTCCC